MNELPTTAFGIMRLLPDTSQGVQIFSTQLINAVKNGEVNPLQLKAIFKIFEKVHEIVSNATKSEQLNEASLYPETKFNAFGFEITKEELGVKYVYANCGDPVYNHRLKIFEEAQDQLEEREKFLKSLKVPITIIDDESGEVATINPPLKTGKSGLKFSLK